MQLGDDSIEKDNNDFSLEDDSSAISWQDLLSEEGDMSNIVNEEKQSSVSNYDINSFVEDEKKEETEQNNNNEDELDLEAYVQESESSQENASDAEINFSENSENKNEEAPVEDVSVPYAGNDDALLIDDDKKVEVEGADLSGIVDDELLNLLDEGENSNASEEEAISFSEALQPAAQPEAYFEETQKSSEPIIQQQDSNNVRQEAPSVDYSQVEIEGENIPPQNQSKKPSPILIICLVVFVLLGIGYGAYTLLSSNSSDNLDADQDAFMQQDDFNNNDMKGPSLKLPDGDTAGDSNPDSAINKIKSKKEKQKEEEEKKLTENKVVFNVSNSGRQNPFVPSSLYKEKGLVGIDTSLPFPPEVIDDDSAKEARKLFDISVTGIMYNSTKPSAILKFGDKEYFVQVGDRIDTYTVHSITKDYVAIQNQYNVWKAFVGEIFEIDANIPPSQKVTTINGRRQYYSSDDAAMKKK